MLLLSSALAATIDPAHLTATSTAPRDGDTSYAASNLADGRLGSVWMEGERGAAWERCWSSTWAAPGR